MFQAEEIILHPAYDDDFATSDVAVIKVKGLIFTEYVQPICIYGPVYDKSQLFGVEATVSKNHYLNFPILFFDIQHSR